MAKDSTFRIVFEGDDSNAIQKVENVVKRLNEARQATSRYSRERQQLAREERRDRFASLTDEEKRTRLLQRQITLERQLARARQTGNKSRESALQLISARNRSSIRQLGPTEAGPSTARELAGMATRGAGMLGISVGIASIAHAITRAVTSAIDFADNIGDLADQTGLTKIQILRLQRASGAAGVSSGVPLAGLSALSSARSAALSGDENAMAAFKRYGIDNATLEGESDNLSIAQAINNSLGSGGMLPTDRGPLGSLLGRRPERTLAVLRQLSNTTLPDEGGIEQNLDKLDKVKGRLDDLSNRWDLLMAKTTAFFAGGAGSTADRVADYQSWWDRNWTTKNRFLKKKFDIEDVFPTGVDNRAGNWADKRRMDDALAPRTALEGPLAEQLKRPAYPIPQSDALARIGLYRGGIDSQRADILKSQLEQLRAIKSAQVETITAIRGNWS